MMKKLLFIALAAVAFAACDPPEKGPNLGLPPMTGSGGIAFSGHNYNIGWAIYTFLEDQTPDDGVAPLDLMLAASTLDFMIEIEMFVDEENGLVPGVYSYAGSGALGTFRNAGVMVVDMMADEAEPEDMALVNGGTVTVGKSGNTYTIALNLTTNDDRTVVGTYTGGLLDDSESDDPDEPGEPDNGGAMSGTLTVGSDDYMAVSGAMTYYGQAEPEEGENVDLLINASDGSTLALQFYVPEGNNKLVAGTYNFASESYLAWTIDQGELYQGYSSYPITGGSVVVSVSGNVYTFVLNLTSAAGNVTGTVSGTPSWASAM
jgi:hypothetical protein